MKYRIKRISVENSNYFISRFTLRGQEISASAVAYLESSILTAHAGSFSDPLVKGNEDAGYEGGDSLKGSQWFT